MVHVATMSPPLKTFLSINLTTKKTLINIITKYLMTNKPTYTKYYSKSTFLINKIKQATKNTIHKLLKHNEKK